MASNPDKEDLDGVARLYCQFISDKRGLIHPFSTGHHSLVVGTEAAEFLDPTFIYGAHLYEVV